MGTAPPGRFQDSARAGGPVRTAAEPLGRGHRSSRGDDRDRGRAADAPVAGTRPPVQTLASREVFCALNASARGLTSADAAARRSRVGPNELTPARRRSLWRELAGQFTDLFFAIVLLVASAISFLAYGLQEPREVGTLQVAVAIAGVVVLNAGIGFAQEYSAERAAESLQAMVPQPAGRCATASGRNCPRGTSPPGTSSSWRPGRGTRGLPPRRGTRGLRQQRGADRGERRRRPYRRPHARRAGAGGAQLPVHGHRRRDGLREGRGVRHRRGDRVQRDPPARLLGDAPEDAATAPGGLAGRSRSSRRGRRPRCRLIPDRSTRTPPPTSMGSCAVAPRGAGRAPCAACS